MNSLKHFPLGAPFPESPHAVASSLPTMRDVCGYEEKDPAVMDAMKSGYPRFVVHAYVRKLIDFYLGREGLAGRAAVLVPYRRAADALADFVGGDCLSCCVEPDLYLIHYNAADVDQAQAVGKYVQHVGCGISSRHAEDLLYQYGQIESVHEESDYVGSAQPFVESEVARLTHGRREDALVCACGMNAFYAAFRAVQEIQSGRGRGVWLQLGWVYLDSGCILKGFLREGETLRCCYDLQNTEALVELIREVGESLAAVFVECPSNPLVQICDLKAVFEAARGAGGVLIVDPTIASIYNMDVLAYADVLVTSLTKYASYLGDVMIGALILNSESPFYSDLVLKVPSYASPPYQRDLRRLAFQMERAPGVVERMNENARRLAKFLRDHPGVRRVFYSDDSDSCGELAKGVCQLGAVITIELSGSLQLFYDSVEVMKGPSFGTSFTLLSPFMYLAHYDLVVSESGRSFLASVGIDYDLVRISVGVEDYAQIERIFDRALSLSIVSG